jgi:hypothetical protein
MTHTLLVSRHAASRARREISGNSALTRTSFTLLRVSFRLPIARSCRPPIRANRRLLLLRERRRETGVSLASCTEQSEHPSEPSRLRRLRERMQHTKLAQGRGHKLPIRHPLSLAPRDQTEAARSAGKKTAHENAARKAAESARPLRKELGSKSKLAILVCRYCGNDGLAPSFIKRRDRRCRECFSKRYGSAARARKAKIKK